MENGLGPGKSWNSNFCERSWKVRNFLGYDVGGEHNDACADGKN